MLTRLLALAVAAAMASAAAPPPVIEIGPHLAQVREFSVAEGDKVWPGYGEAPFGFLLVTNKQESLLCRDIVPQGFKPAGRDKATGCARFTRPRTGLPANLLAAMPLFGLPSVIVMGTPEATGRTEANWVRTILHEHFHQWQYELPGYFDRLKALDLHGGDETGMWILNYAFPYKDPAVAAAFGLASNALADAVAARGTPQFGSAFDSYLGARQALEASAGEDHWRYMEFQLWQEGVARWTEIRLGKWYPRQDVRDSAARLEEPTLAELRAPNLPDRKRVAFYAYGAAEAMLLQACGHRWRADYPNQLSLGPLLAAARTHCAAIGRA
jgi:hypothetical protein